MNRKPFHLQTLQTFPSDPAELPTDNYAFAYDDSDPPVYMNIQHLAEIEKSIPLRNTHKSLNPSGGSHHARPERSSASRGQSRPYEQPRTNHAYEQPRPRRGLLAIGDDVSYASKSPAGGNWSGNWSSSSRDWETGNIFDDAPSDVRRTWTSQSWGSGAWGSGHSASPHMSRSPSQSPSPSEGASVAGDTIASKLDSALHPAQDVKPMASRLAGLSLGKLAPTPKVSIDGGTDRKKTTEEIENEVYERLLSRDKSKKDVAAKRRRLLKKTSVEPVVAEALAAAVPAADAPAAAPVKKRTTADDTTEPVAAAIPAVKPLAGAPVMKRPSGIVDAHVAPVPALAVHGGGDKRPRADLQETPGAKYVVEWVPGLKTKRSYMCGQRGRAVRKATKIDGLSGEAVVAVAKVAYQEASQMWDRHQ